MKKTCNKCKKEKSVVFFSKDSTKKDKLQASCKECKKTLKTDWVLKNKDHINKYQKQYLLENTDKKLEYNKQKIEYRALNRDKIRNKQREYFKKRRKNDFLFLLRRNISTLIRNCFKNKNHTKKSKASSIIDCSFEEFKSYIESKWESWMSWDNYGKYNGEFKFGWDLDHIIPVCSAVTENELIKLNHYTNFQPLCSKINRDIKNGKTK